jgi:hypothetical protein
MNRVGNDIINFIIFFKFYIKHIMNKFIVDIQDTSQLIL